MSLLKKKLLALAVVALAPLAAHATVPNSTFQFYFEGPIFDEVSTAPTFISGDLGVTAPLRIGDCAHGQGAIDAL